MHSVPHHSLDVAASAAVLISAFKPPVVVPADALITLMALHDIGKFSRPFQAKVKDLWPPSLGVLDRPSGYQHDDVGYALLSGPLSSRLDRLFVNWRSPSARDPLFRAVTGHHGRPPCELEMLPRVVACTVCVDAAATFTDEALDVIDPPPLPRLDTADRHHLAWFLAGLAVVSDWLGSGRRWFRPVVAADHTDLRRYWCEVALPRAREAARDAGLLPSPVSPHTGLAQIFPGRAARPVQSWAETVPLPDGPTLFTIEDATGSGKTEAALVLAHRLMAAGRSDGLFFALPTMATADAMYARLANAYERLFAPGSRPSLVLAHGRRALHARFTESILDGAVGPQGDSPEPADQSAGAQCAAWIADDRRKAFLAEIGVGTIDQALMAVLPTRHAPLRLLGLSRRVLIVDEAHAYDAYMTEELRRMLAFQAALGGSAIVLSATLTAAQRSGLASAFLGGLGGAAEPDGATAYPLVSTVSAAGVVAEPCAIAAEMKRRVVVERVTDKTSAARLIEQAAASGAAVAWVRNAVDDAIEAHADLQALGLDPLLFHARFAMGDRQTIEHQVLALFGPESSAEERRGRVLVATQVVEQSLDLDFDLMVTDLAPADLVIQRAGRLWRHSRGERPIAGPRLLLLAPEPIEDPPENWLGSELRRAGYVYGDHALLWRSARALLEKGFIDTPEGIRALVEAAYDRDSPGAEPPGLDRATIRAKAGWLAARGIAWQNLLEIDRPYQRDAGLWEPDVRTPTRLGDPQITLRLARVEDGGVVPWCADTNPRRAWALSEVSVRVARLAGLAGDAATDKMVTAVKRDWPTWDREIPVLVLRPDARGGWRGDGVDQHGNACLVTHGPSRGLVIARETA